MRSVVRCTVAVMAALTLAAPAAAQARGVQVTPLIGYLWGGGYSTDAFDVIPAGKLEVDASLAYGVELGFMPRYGTVVELTYLRQDTDIRFQPSGGGSQSASTGFATNYIHIGGRAELGNNPRVKPFIGGGLGLTVFDVKEPGFGTSTDFSLSIHGGVKAMFGQDQRFGALARVRGWFSFVPSGDIYAWCNVWGYCYASEGTTTVSQGEVSAGLVIAF